MFRDKIPYIKIFCEPKDTFAKFIFGLQPNFLCSFKFRVIQRNGNILPRIRLLKSARLLL